MDISISKYTYHYKQLCVLGLPIVIGQLGNIVLGFADTMMVGRHSMEELAAASFVNTMVSILILFALGFSNGLVPIIGAMFGRGETEKIGGMVKNAMLANQLVAVIFMALLIILYFTLHLLGQPEELLPLMKPYLLVTILSLPFMSVMNVFKQTFDTIGDTKTPMYVILGGNTLNIVGNYLLIYGALGFPELGLLGAGISTLFSRAVMAAVLAWAFFRAKRYAVLSKGYSESRLNGEDFKQLNKLGWPLGLQLGMEIAAFSMTTLFVGWIGTIALAGHQIMLIVSEVFYMVYYGMAAAVAVRVSYYRGQNELQALRDVTMAGLHIILMVAVVVSVPIILLRNDIAYLFTDSQEVALLVAGCIAPLIIYQFGDGMQCIYGNALRGLAVVKPLFYGSFVSYFIVSLPLSWLFGIYFGWGLVGIWMAFPICLTLAGIWYYTAFKRKLKVWTMGTKV